MKKNNIISIIGKTNVGKSTLFNLLIRKRKSIVSNNIDTTRSKNYGILNIKNNNYLLIDTGGYYNNVKKKNKLKKKILNQILLTIKKSYLILFVVDIVYGITDIDKSLTKILKKNNNKVFLIINKIDKNNKLNNYYNYCKLGFLNIYPISCSHNIGIKILCKDINLLLKKKKKKKKRKNKYIYINIRKS
ncbi:MAG: 50S ribosome-binding GTPase [Candidatus Shikimatogenerans bostrichidophilus]|nr:MAG: 50S ribosome-binding GTPase [Candidatus Shikimatogenerans bostrichidophilus]